jgi:hypothetical protein
MDQKLGLFCAVQRKQKLPIIGAHALGKAPELPSDQDVSVV